MKFVYAMCDSNFKQVGIRKSTLKKIIYTFYFLTNLLSYDI